MISSLLKALVFVALLQPLVSWAHGHESDEDVEALGALMLQIAELTPEVLDDAPSVSEAYVKVGGRKVALNGPFWELVQGWIRVYYREIQKDCGDCIQMDEEQFLRAAEDHRARSFFNLKVSEPLLEGVEHISVGTADIGARLGTVGLVLKATGEVAEGVLSKMVGGGGVHIVCNLIDAIIIFGLRHMQTTTRMFSWAPRLQSWRTWNLVKVGFVGASMRRAQKRANFVLPEPVEIDTEGLRQIDMEGPNRWWGWADHGKRAAWVRKVLKRKGNGRETTLVKREVLGSRMKRYLMLKGRKRGHRQFLRGENSMDKVLGQNVIWVLAVQENILQRSLVPTVAEMSSASAARATVPEALAYSHSADNDEIRRGLAREFSEANQVFIEDLLREVEVAFNPTLPKRMRYFQALKLEALLGGFVYGVFNRVLGEAGELYGHSFRGIWRQSKLHWHSGRFASYIYEWGDFLRLASLNSSADSLDAHKYESMEALLRLFRHLQKTSTLVGVETVEQLISSEATLKAGYAALTTFRPWKEKRVARSWLPWGRRATCRELNEVAP